MLVWRARPFSLPSSLPDLASSPGSPSPFLTFSHAQNSRTRKSEKRRGRAWGRGYARLGNMIVCLILCVYVQDHILVVGWTVVVLLSGEDGTVTASLWSNCQPVAPLVIADFTGDGLNDIIITCADK